MLRVIVELVPFGVEKDKKTIGEMVIANVGRGGDGTNYIGHFADDRGNEHYAFLQNHDRSKQVLELVRLISEVMLLEKPESLGLAYMAVSERLAKKNKFKKKQEKRLQKEALNES